MIKNVKNSFYYFHFTFFYKKILKIQLIVKTVKNWKLKLNFCYFWFYSKFNNLKKNHVARDDFKEDISIFRFIIDLWKNFFSIFIRLNFLKLFFIFPIYYSYFYNIKTSLEKNKLNKIMKIKHFKINNYL